MMTDERLAVIREAVARYDGTPPAWKGAEEWWVDIVRECAAEIERLRASNERQVAALRAVREAWDCGALAYVADEGGEAIEAARRALEADGR